MKADIWMPLYIGDYLADTSRLTTEQHGAYLLLIMDYWRSGRPPDNDQVLAQICKLSPDAWSNAKAMLKQYFIVEEGFWVHKRIESEIAAANENKEKRHERAIKGAKARWNNATSSATSNPQAMLIQCPSPSPSPSTSHTTTKELAAKAAPATRLSEDWQLPDDWAIWAKQERPDLNPNKVADSFKDYWIAQPSAKGKKTNWQATWRNWVRNQKADPADKTFEAPWVKQNREWFDEARGVKPEKNFFDMETNLTRIEK